MDVISTVVPLGILVSCYIWPPLLSINLTWDRCKSQGGGTVAGTEPSALQ